MEKGMLGKRVVTGDSRTADIGSIRPLAMSVATAMLLFGTVATSCGAELPPRLQAGPHRLLLNGQGGRTKTFVQLYEAGLYLSQPTNQATTIIGDDEPMAIRIKITSGFVSQAKLIASLEEGFENSTGGKTQSLEAEITKFRACFQGPVKKGDVIDLVYVPEHGVIVNHNGKLKGVIAGLAFKQALFGIWLSDAPADKGLKQAMLAAPRRR